MRLSKTVCKACYKECGRLWHSSTELDWKNHILKCPEKVCPTDMKIAVVLTEREPSDWCPFAMEHLISQGS